MTKNISIFLGIGLVAVICFVLFAGVGVASAATYYASPGGGGDGSSSSKPFQIADFWPKAKSGDTLILLDGTYTGSRSMVDPPNGLSGKEGSPIIIKALNDGKVTIDGERSRLPIWLNHNNWFIIEGLNAGRAAKVGHAYGSGAVVFIEYSDHNIVRRVCAWDAPNDNTNIFTIAYSSDYNLIEDCAVWGRGRKSVLTTVANYNVFRRFFGVAQGESQRGLFAGINSPYYGTGNIMENCIETVDILPDAVVTGVYKLFGAATECTLDYKQATHYLYGCIAYRKVGQRGYTNSMLTPIGSGTGIGNVPVRGFKQYIVKDMVIYNELDNQGVDWYGLYAPYLKTGEFFYEDFQLKNITFIGRRSARGSPHINFYTTYGDSSYHSIRNAISIGSDVGFQSSGGDFISDYVWAYNNAQNFKGGIPKHYRTDALDLTANGGNILQYGLSEEERPKVNGKSVGAQIQYRYVNGKLTNEPLWPWPMNQRIIDAMKQSGYKPIDVTREVFELGGGTMPDFGPRYDVNEDGKVDILDIIIVGQHFGETTNPPYPSYDVNEDGKVGILDIIIVGQHFGEITR